MVSRWTLPGAVLLVAALPRLASAQMGPGAGPQGQVGGEEEQKPEGAAEKAPTEPGQLPSTPYLPPYPGEEKKAFELVQIDGYFRLRTEWRSKLNLGFTGGLNSGQEADANGNNGDEGSPFPPALSCLGGSTTKSSTCGSSVGSANMRLRLAPVVNLSEKVSLHVEIDVLDNVVLGSTPDGFFLDDTASPANVPIDAFADSQSSPEGGRNALTDSIRVKRAWGEVETALGTLRFGRMPDHFGLGLRSNSGYEDPLTGDVCLDCDSGDTVDRVIFSGRIPGTPLAAAVGMDWASTGPTSSRLYPDRDEGRIYDLDDADDVRQWVFQVSDWHDAATNKEKIDGGGTVFDWGARVTYRAQGWQVRDNTDTSMGGTIPPLQGQFKLRSAYMYIPDAYVRFATGKLNIEAEAVAVIGEVRAEDLDSDTDVLEDATSIRQVGAVARLNYLMADDEFNLGLEAGFASGDDLEAKRTGDVHYTEVPVLPLDDTDNNSTAFLFDPNYHVDLILFRELLGTVRNATYIKPNFSYELTGRLRLSGAVILAFANVPVSTPGNDSLWGLELDGNLGYHNDKEGFFAGISYGALFPLGAMDHPGDLFPNNNKVDAETAQIMKANLTLKF